MPKKKVCETSSLAHESVKEHKSAVHEKIIKALEELKVGGTSEEIATYLEMDHEVIWKRMSELVTDGKVFNLENVTRPTKKGRKSMVRQLVKLKEPDIGSPDDIF